MSGINIAEISSKTLLGATFAQAAYPNKDGTVFTPPVGFIEVEDVNHTPTADSSLTGFSARAFVNVKTGELVIAYRGSDNPWEAVNAASWAANGTWHPQLTDATNYAAAARTAALAKINEYRLKPENGLQPLTQIPNDNILVTGHSLGGLLSQVVSKMFGWSAQVYDSLGMALNGAKMVVDTAIYNNKGEVPGNVMSGANITLADLDSLESREFKIRRCRRIARLVRRHRKSRSHITHSNETHAVNQQLVHNF